MKGNVAYPKGGAVYYRSAFQGQEKDDEVYGSIGTSYTAEFWQYDPRVARRWNLDPVFAPWESGYAAFRNNPIFLNDPNGDCADCGGGGDEKPGFESGKGTTENPIQGPEAEVFGSRSGAAKAIYDRSKDIAGLMPGNDNSSWEVGRGSYGGSLGQYKKDFGLPGGMDRHDASNWQEGALREWNTQFGLPSNTPYEGSWDAWYKTTDYYRQDQAQAASGLLLGGHILAAQMQVFMLGGFPKAQLQVSKGFQLQPRYEPFNASIDDVLNNPSLLSGRSLSNVQSGLQYDASRWMQGALTRGTHQGQGWKLLEHGGNKSMRWNPGGGQHGPNPYWRTSDGHVKSPRMPSWGK
jgi:hypothetical protein